MTIDRGLPERAQLRRGPRDVFIRGGFAVPRSGLWKPRSIKRYLEDGFGGGARLSRDLIEFVMGNWKISFKMGF